MVRRSSSSLEIGEEKVLPEICMKSRHSDSLLIADVSRMEHFLISRSVFCSVFLCQTKSHYSQKNPNCLEQLSKRAFSKGAQKKQVKAEHLHVFSVLNSPTLSRQGSSGSQCSPRGCRLEFQRSSQTQRQQHHGASAVHPGFTREGHKVARSTQGFMCLQRSANYRRFLSP